MNGYIKEIIINNEKELLMKLPEYKKSIQQLIKKIEKSTTDGVLYGILKSSLTGNNKKRQIDDYHRKGFISSYELLCNNLDFVNLEEKPSLSNLIEGKKYNQYDICCIANNYNNQVGMYYVDDLNVIIKSTVEDNDRPYDDRWITKGTMLRYFMQKEKEECLKTLIFRNKPNITIFNALMECKMINIYAFINTKKGDDYVFEGVFHPCGIICNNKAFILFKEGFENEIPFNNIDGLFIRNLLKDNRYPDTVNLKLTSVLSSPFKINENLGIMKQSKKNCIQRMQIQLEVKLRGEDLVLQYERNKLISAGHAELAAKVENISLYDSNLGYDIKSFDVDSNGCISESLIKVLSCVTEKCYPFELSSKEIENITSKQMRFKIYRVFNIYTNKPKLQVIGQDELISKYNFCPSKYEVN